MRLPSPKKPKLPPKPNLLQPVIAIFYRRSFDASPFFLKNRPSEAVASSFCHCWSGARIPQTAILHTLVRDSLSNTTSHSCPKSSPATITQRWLSHHHLQQGPILMLGSIQVKTTSSRMMHPPHDHHNPCAKSLQEVSHHSKGHRPQNQTKPRR